MAAQNITKKIQVDSKKNVDPLFEWLKVIAAKRSETVRSEWWKVLKRVEMHSMVSEMPVAELKLGWFPKGLGRFFKRHGIDAIERREQEILAFAASILCHPSLLQLPGKGTDWVIVTPQQSTYHVNSDFPELHLEAKGTGKELFCLCSPLTSDKPPWNQ